jgi:integrase
LKRYDGRFFITETKTRHSRRRIALTPTVCDTLRCHRALINEERLPLIRFHDLRHTATTLLLLAGVHPKVVSEMLGHASIAITLDLCIHVLPDMQREATLAMERALNLGAGEMPPLIGVKIPSKIDVPCGVQAAEGVRVTV